MNNIDEEVNKAYESVSKKEDRNYFLDLVLDICNKYKSGKELTPKQLGVIDKYNNGSNASSKPKGVSIDYDMIRSIVRDEVRSAIVGLNISKQEIDVLDDEIPF